MKKFLSIAVIVLSFVLHAFADQKILALDVDETKYVYYDGHYWNYVWLNTELKEVTYIIKSIYDPSHYHYSFKPISNKVVIGEVQIGAKIQ